MTGGIVLTLCGPARAETWPARPVVITVVGGPGSPPDRVARELSEHISRSIGKPVVIENQAGGGGIVGMDQVRRARPDGYRFVFSHAMAIVANPALYKSLPYHPERDFEPVSLLISGPMILVATPSLGVASAADLIRLARSKPGTLFYGSTGVAGPSNIFFEQFRLATSLSIDQVAFKGPLGLVQALQGEQVMMAMESYTALSALIAAGKARPLAVSGDSRLTVLPDVPTFKELGILGMGVSWFAVLAPKGTPREIIRTMQREISRALAAPGVRQAQEALGRRVIDGGPEELAALIHEELPHWRDLIGRLGITVQ